MAKTSEVAAPAAVPSSADIERAAKFAREPFLLDGEGPEALAPGTARRQALDAALGRSTRGPRSPRSSGGRTSRCCSGWSGCWPTSRRPCATAPSSRPHQVDALSGTLAELMAEQQAAARLERRNGERRRRRPTSSRTPRRAEAADAEANGEEARGRGARTRTRSRRTGRSRRRRGRRGDRGGARGSRRRPALLVRARDRRRQDGRRGRLHRGDSRTGGVLILTHRRNLVDQFIGEISDRGYKERLRPPLLDGRDDPDGPVTVETYQWFVRNHKKVSDAYSIVICDEAHTALGEKTSACIRAWPGPVFIGMTATGALIARHVADLFPTQTSRFDLAQAARRGVISPLRCLRIPPGPGVRTIAKVPLRKGEVDQDFDQEELAALLDQEPFNVAIADLYKSRFRKVARRPLHRRGAARKECRQGVPRRSGSSRRRSRARRRSASWPRSSPPSSAARSTCSATRCCWPRAGTRPRATICMHLAPTASRRVYQQRVGRVTRRAPGKEAGLVIDFVHPATTHDETIVTLHSLLDRDVYRGGAIVVGPVRRGRGRKVRVERRIVPVSDVEERRMEVLEREIWRIAVENLDYPEQHAWAALAGARVNPQGWRRARAMLQNDQTKELRRRFLLTCVQRNRNAQLRLKALGEIADLGDAEAFDDAIEIVGTWSREDKRAGTKTLLQALIDKRIGRRDQAQAWVWRLASYTRELHEEYAVQRWPETKRLLGLLVNSSGRAHGRNARRLVHAARKQDRRLAVSLLAAAVSHTPEGEEVLRGARMRMARKPSAIARELLRNFPKGGKAARKRANKRQRGRRRRRRATQPEVHRRRR